LRHNSTARALRVIRAFRVLRVLRLFSFMALWVPRLNLIIGKLAAVVPNLLPPFIVIILVMYGYCIIGCEIYGESFEGLDLSDPPDWVRFPLLFRFLIHTLVWYHMCDTVRCHGKLLYVCDRITPIVPAI
jgi:hypothetical protein